MSGCLGFLMEFESTIRRKRYLIVGGISKWSRSLLADG
jgi:hypothetical protein